MNSSAWTCHKNVRKSTFSHRDTGKDTENHENAAECHDLHKQTSLICSLPTDHEFLHITSSTSILFFFRNDEIYFNTSPSQKHHIVSDVTDFSKAAVSSFCSLNLPRKIFPHVYHQIHHHCWLKQRIITIQIRLFIERKCHDLTAITIFSESWKNMVRP